jgi:hypothetical protein
VLRLILQAGAGGGPVAIAPDLGDLQTGIPFQGNRVIRSDRVGLRSAPEGSPRRSTLTMLLQLPWQIALGRLRPRTSPPGEVSHARGE